MESFSSSSSTQIHLRDDGKYHGSLILSYSADGKDNYLNSGEIICDTWEECRNTLINLAVNFNSELPEQLDIEKLAREIKEFNEEYTKFLRKMFTAYKIN